MTILNASDQTKIRTGATRNVLQKTDRILGQSHVEVKIESTSVPAPAYTDGKTITIAANMDPIEKALRYGFTPKTMMLATALNYHELAHVMFTPRLNAPLAHRVKKAGYFMSFNILEDQAAETRFVKLYEPSRHYFTSLVTNYMMQNKQYLEANYVLVSGRLFLPQRFRDSFRDNFTKPEIIPDVDRLVAEYKTLITPQDDDRMFEVIEEFHHLINEVNATHAGTPHDSLTEGKPSSDQMDRIKNDKEFVNSDPEDDDEEGQQGSGEGEDDDESDDEGQSSKSNGSEQDDAGSDDDSDGDDDEGEDDDADEFVPSGKHEKPSNREKPDNPPRSKKDLEKAVEDAMREAIDEAMHEMEEELDDRIDSVKDEESNYTVEGEITPARTRPPSPGEIATVNRCIDEFRQVEMQQAPGWHLHQRSGKLDPRRYPHAMRGSPYVYKRWREGINDALDFEVVFLLDESGSMSNDMDNASASLWILKRTFEECNGIGTVLGFSDGMHLLNQRFEQAKPHVVPVYPVIGLTYVADALREAKRILATSMKPLKLCVVISDGGFHDHADAKKVVQSFGGPVFFVGISTDVSIWDGVQNVVHTQQINAPTELVDVVKNLALRLSDERLKKKGLA